MDIKSVLTSKTIWAGTFLLLAFVASRFFGVEVTPEDQVEATNNTIAYIESTVAFVAYVGIWIGRFMATKKVTLTGK